MPNTNEKRIVGAAGRRFERFEPVTGVTEEEAEAMLSSLPKLPKASDIAKAVGKFGLYVAPVTGEYYAYKDYQEYSKQWLEAKEKYREIQYARKHGTQVAGTPMMHQAGMFTGAGPVAGYFLMSALASAGPRVLSSRGSVHPPKSYPDAILSHASEIKLLSGVFSI